MKTLYLTDRIVVEIKREKNEDLLWFIADRLEIIAAKIKEGYRGGAFKWGDEPDCPANTEVLWEHECPEYGGFKIVGNKSLISQYYYHSELAPRIISEELAGDIRKFNMDYEENEQEVGEDIETKTDYLCDAVNLLAQVEQETKIVL